MVFCKIDQSLINLINKYAKGKQVVDIGCGEGLLGSMRPNTISIDLLPHEHEFITDIIHINVINFPFNRQHFPVFIRPCHGSFVEAGLETFKDIVSGCLYISNPDNLENDIDTLIYNPVMDKTWIGEEGERVFYLNFNEENGNKEKYYRIVMGDFAKGIDKDQLNYQSSWRTKGYRWDRDVWINSVGGMCPISKNDIILEECEADSFDDLDWSHTYLNDPTQKSGWIAPDGIFYGCESQDHIVCAQLVLRKDIDVLEKEGYVHLYIDGTYSCETYLTENQNQRLIDMGIKTDKDSTMNISDPSYLGKDWEVAKRFMPHDGD